MQAGYLRGDLRGRIVTRPSLAGIEQRTERSPMSTWTAVPALTTTVRDVLALHNASGERWEGFPRADRRVAYCTRDGEAAPCPTVRALATHLDLTDPEGEPT